VVEQLTLGVVGALEGIDKTGCLMAVVVGDGWDFEGEVLKASELVESLLVDSTSLHPLNDDMNGDKIVVVVIEGVSFEALKSSLSILFAAADSNCAVVDAFFVVGVRCNNSAVNVHWLEGIVVVGDDGGLRSLIFVAVVVGDWSVFGFPYPY
jgi:hypothetical protein